MSRKIKIYMAVLATLMISYIAPFKALAATCTNPQTDPSCVCSSQGCDNGAPTKTAIDCPSGRVNQQDASKCAPLGNDCNGNSTQKCLKQSAFIQDINKFVNFAAAAVGVVVIAMIILGGVQYSMAGDNPNATGEAKKRIINSLIALAAFIFMYAFLQWLIPGGI